jgi:hypothetical protein
VAEQLLHSGQVGARGDEVVVRFGQNRSGFEDGRQVMVYASPDLPVTDMQELADAFGGGYAVSQRPHDLSGAGEPSVTAST